GGSGGDTTMGTGGATDAAPPSEGGTTVPDASGEAGGPSDLAGPSNLADLADLADDASVVGWAGVPGIEDLSTVKPTAGCGQDPGQALGSWVQHTIVTPMTRLGSITRTYFVKLPANYDRNKPYRLIYEGTSCGGGPTAVPDFTALAGADGVIAIAMQRRDGVHTDGPGGPNCFDDWNSMSIEYPFFETMHLAVSKTLCFDAHRVFIVGHSSGAWLSNNVGCYFGSKYIRAISPHEGGFSQQPNYPVYGPPPTGMPTCNDLPTPGLWQHNHDDPNNPISANIRAITRALKVNRCTDTDFATAKTTLYAAPGTNGVCKQYTSCPKEFPIVFCDPATGGHTGNMMFGAAWQFFKAF
ncbi:MAG TPA: hypothetical protein VFH73_12620, partial [Polyangia bacterium]|nr:hypothetical protein [Polyangia bacterium]